MYAMFTQVVVFLCHVNASVFFVYTVFTHFCTCCCVHTNRLCVCMCVCMRVCVCTCVWQVMFIQVGYMFAMFMQACCMCCVHAGVLYVLCSCRRVVCAVFMQACRMCCVHAGVLYVLCSRRRVVFVIQGMEMKNVRWDGGGNLLGSSAKLTQDEVHLCEYMTSYYVSTQHNLICVSHTYYFST